MPFEILFCWQCCAADLTWIFKTLVGETYMILQVLSGAEMLVTLAALKLFRYRTFMTRWICLARKNTFALLALQIEMNGFFVSQKWSNRCGDKTAVGTPPLVIFVYFSNVFLELELRVKCRVACFTPGRPLAQAGSFNMKAAEGSVAENNPAIGAGSILGRFGRHAVRSDVLVRVAVRVEGLEADLTGKSVTLNLKSKRNYKRR